MKFTNTTLNKALFFVLTCTFLGHVSILHAQNNEPVTLVGTWTFDHNVSMAKVVSTMQRQLDTVPQLKQQLRALYEGRKMFFGPNGEYVQSLADGRSVSGIWSLAPDNVLTVTNAAGASMKQQLAYLGRNRLTLIPIVSGDTQALISEWHFKKDKKQ